jgi:hypothetical protein
MKTIKSISGTILYRSKEDKQTIKELLQEAIKQGADLREADLYRADLYRADLSEADLSGAYLYRADLSEADLSRAYLDINKIKHRYQIVPEEGSFIAWKKAGNKENCLVKLKIPENAKRHNAITGRKCRAEFVDVITIYDSEGNEIEKCVGTRDDSIIYEKGKRVFPDNYDPDPRVECSNGIHFFLTKQEAIEW